MTIRNALQFCEQVEQRLGWCPPGNKPGAAFRRYGAYAHRVNEKVRSDPEKYTWRNLELALELLARERLERNPLGVFAHVDRAIEKGREVEVDLDQQIREAMAHEQRRGDPDDWVTRFTRAQGIYRQHAYDEWKASQ